MLTPWPGFIGPSYTDQSPITDAEQCINWYPELTGSPNAASRVVLYPTPGLTSFGSVAQGPCRALFAQNGRCFAVIGSYFYEIASNGTMTPYGQVSVNQNPATICSNGSGGNQVFITCGDKGYIFNLNTLAFTTVLNSGATVGDYFSGFFLCLDSTLSKLQISGAFDGTTWDPTQVAYRSAAADAWTGMAVVHRDIWLLGSQTTEAWYNSGAYPFPFEPNPSGFIEQGMAATFSYASMGDSVIWLGRSMNGGGVVWRSNGYTPNRISNHALETAMQNYGTITDAVAYSYQEQGHHFYVLTFPSANATWVYDLATEMWHQRGWWNVATNQFDASRALHHCYVFDKHLVGDRLTGTIWSQEDTVYTDADGAALRRVRRTPHIAQNQGWLFYRAFQIEMQTGMGLQSGQGYDPQVMMRFSNDGGLTFGNEEWVSAGKAGEYLTRVRWTRLGRARQRVFEVAVSDPVPFRLTQAYLDVERGTS